MPYTAQQLSDRAEIHDAIVAYSVALDHPGRRWDLWYKAFTEDAVLDYPGLGPVSPQKAQEIFDKNTHTRLAIQHLFLNIWIELKGDTADVRSECLFATLSKTDSPDLNILLRSGLWFEDKLVRTAAGWRIAHRKAHNRWSESVEQRAAS